MSHASSKNRSFWLRLDILIAIAGILFSLLAIPLYRTITNLFILGIPIAIGFGSIIYLLSAVGRDPTSVAPVLPQWTARLLPSLSFLGITGLILLSTIQGTRSVWYYHLAIGVAVLILYQIVFTDDREFSPALLLGQIVLFAGVLRFTALGASPGYVGIDIWTHVPAWTSAIIETNRLTPLEGQKYYGAPWFHLLVASMALLGGFQLEQALHLSVGIAMVFAVIVVYVAARHFLNPRWATFAAALFGIVGYSIEWSIHLIPTSLGIVFFAGIFLLLCRLILYGYDRGEFTLLVLLNIAVVLTHQIATFITLILLSAAVLAVALDPRGPNATSGPANRHRDSANLLGLTIFDLGFVTFMWSLTPYHGRSFLETTLIFFQDTLTETEGFGDLAGQRQPDEAPPIEPSLLEQVIGVVDASVFVLLFLLMVLGGLHALQYEQRSPATWMMGMSLIGMCIFVFGFPMFGIRSFIPTRWYAFMAIPMIILGALGIRNLSRRLPAGAVTVLFVCFLLVFPAAAMISTSATLDSPRFEGEQTRYGYTASELATVDAVDRWFPYDEDTENVTLRTDHPYQTVFERTEAHEAGMVSLTESGVREPNYVVWREYQRSGAAYFNDEYNRSHTPTVDQSVVCPLDRSIVYDNGAVSICGN